MTAKAALCIALLEGRVLNIKNGFDLFGITNIPREISRCIEQPFEVEVSRVRREGKSRYGQPVTWFDYRLNKSDRNLPGIEKMREYVIKHMPKSEDAKTEKEKKLLRQTELFLNQ